MPSKKHQVNHEFTYRIGSLLTVVAQANEGGRYPGMLVQISTQPGADDNLKRLTGERCKWVQAYWPTNSCSPACRFVQSNYRRVRFTLRFQDLNSTGRLRFLDYQHLINSLVSHLTRDLTIS